MNDPFQQVVVFLLALLVGMNIGHTLVLINIERIVKQRYEIEDNEE